MAHLEWELELELAGADVASTAEVVEAPGAGMEEEVLAGAAMNVSLMEM